MTTASNITAAERANSRPEKSTYRPTSKFRLIEILSAKAKHLWRNKVAEEWADRAGVSVRTAEGWLAVDRSINGNAFYRLLMSPEGPAFLEALIAEQPPSRRAVWQRELELVARRADLRQKLETLEQQR